MNKFSREYFIKKGKEGAEKRKQDPLYKEQQIQASALGHAMKKAKKDFLASQLSTGKGVDNNI